MSKERETYYKLFKELLKKEIDLANEYEKTKSVELLSKMWEIDLEFYEVRTCICPSPNDEEKKKYEDILKSFVKNQEDFEVLDYAIIKFVGEFAVAKNLASEEAIAEAYTKPYDKHNIASCFVQSRETFQSILKKRIS